MEWGLPVKPESIVEDIKEAAESAVQQSGFVYETSSGMYYDYNTGYYYDAVRIIAYFKLLFFVFSLIFELFIT